MFTLAAIILFVLLFVLLAVLTFARDLLVSFLSAVVGIFRKNDPSKKNDEGRQTIRRRDRNKKKVYSDSDGEYVDFEEVKKR